MNSRPGALQTFPRAALRGLFSVGRIAAAGLVWSAAFVLTTTASAEPFGWSDPYAMPPAPSAWQQAAESLTFQSLHEDAPSFLRYQPAWHEQPDFRAHALATAPRAVAPPQAAAPPLAEREGPSARFASYAMQGPQTPDLYDGGGSFADPYGAAGGQGGITRQKDGFFQKLNFTETWLYQGNSDDLGMNSLETYITFALPAPTADTPFLITPGFGAHFLDGPDGGPFLPGQVYDAYVSLLWLGKINDRWSLTLGATPGVYSDFEQYDDGAFRTLWRAIVTWKWKPGVLEVVGGVVYLDRQDVTWVPAAGLIWTPFDGMRWDLVVPKPKLAHRFACGCGWEDWLYLAGEFGGGSWQIQQPGGELDQVSISDYRLIFGMERLLNGGADWRLEIGWVFGREIEYADGATYEPDDTLMLRGGLTF